MDTQLILSIISDDEPGVVKHLAQIVSQHSGNWQESRLTQLAGKFAGVVRISVDSQQRDALQQALTALKTQGIRVLVEDIDKLNRHVASRSARFSLAGPDRPGIVLEITQAFMRYQINVEDLNTHCSSMPYSGEPLFEADGVLSLPTATDLEQLSDQLEEIGDNLGLDIHIEETAAQ